MLYSISFDILLVTKQVCCVVAKSLNLQIKKKIIISKNEGHNQKHIINNDSIVNKILFYTTVKFMFLNKPASSQRCASVLMSIC